MSIGIGIVSSQGHVILAADTKYTTGGVVNYGDKIIPLPLHKNYGVVVAGAGDVGFIRAAADKLNAALPEQAGSVTSLAQVIDHSNKKFYQEYFVAAGDASLSYELLIAVGIYGQGAQLFKTSANTLAMVKTYDVIGTGGVTCQPYNGMWSDDMDDYEAQLMGVFLVKYAKMYDEYCGGESRLFKATSHSLYRFDPIYVSAAEEYFETFNRTALEMLIPLQDPKTDAEMFSGYLGDLVKEAQWLRDSLWRMEPHTYKRVAHWGPSGSMSEKQESAD